MENNMITSTKSEAHVTHVSSGWIDVTTTITNGMVHWPGDAEVVISKTSSIEKGDEANVTALCFSAHVSTHVDAPRHFIAGGKDVTEIDLNAMLGLAKVFSIQNTETINLDEIKNFKISEGDRVLFRTRNSNKDWPKLPFLKNHVYLETDAASYLCDKGIACVGIDYLSISGEKNAAEVHKLLLQKEIVIIEGLMLDEVDDGDYEMICLPLKIAGADGAPARVIVRKI